MLLAGYSNLEAEVECGSLVEVAARDRWVRTVAAGKCSWG
jgi:hypothetical protein